MENKKEVIWEGKPDFYPYLVKSFQIITVGFKTGILVYLIFPVMIYTITFFATLSWEQPFLSYFVRKDILIFCGFIILLSVGEAIKYLIFYPNLKYSVLTNSLKIQKKLFREGEVEFRFDLIKSCRLERQWIDKYFEVGTIVFSCGEYFENDNEKIVEKEYQLEFLRNFEEVYHMINDAKV
ncbi:hypothetical protein [Flexithrix dorotheae]|uniref:hypothetical protein n=1 Tax=Flexithrix dorotheae TaxID=70993 RepID=UPI0012F89E63|nr:hypothetical protein [Flexithrix dorotheae]